MAKISINLPLMIILLTIFFFVLGSNIIWAIPFVGILIVAEVFGIISGLFKTELKEMDKAEPKPPEGKKFIEKGLSRTGKALGKGEKARMEGKRIRDDRELFSVAGKAAGDFFGGIEKIFKK